MSGKSALFFTFCAGLALTVSANAASITPATPALDKADNCYQISTAAELYGFVAITNGQGASKNTSACGKLTQDIVVNENVLDADGALNTSKSDDFASWTPIASFSGTFDGQGHKISGIYYNNNYGTSVGLIGVITGGTTESPVVVKNLEIVDSYFHYSDVAGGIASTVKNGVAHIYNIAFSGTMEGRYVQGGIVGRADAGSTVYIDNCLFDGKLTGQTNSGGMVGQTLNGNLYLSNSVSAGSVVYGGSGSQLSMGVKVLFGNKYSGSFKIDNCFYLESEGVDELGGSAVTSAQFADGSVTKALRIYQDLYRDVDGSIWGQKVGTDTYPLLSGKLEGYTGTTAEIVFHTYSGDKIAYASEYVPGYKVTLPVAYREGYQFMGWYSNSSFSGSIMTEIPSNASGTQEFWAKFAKIYKVTLNAEGGTIDSADVTAYTEGIGAALPKKVTRPGYVFRGWVIDGDANETFVDSITTKMSGDLTFNASWFGVKAPSKGSDGCYEISSSAELYGFAGLINGIYGITKSAVNCAKLTADIEVNKNVLKANGTLDSSKIASFVSWNPIDGFSGEFDGQGHKISGLYSVSINANGGLFGLVKGGTATKPVTLKNVGLVDSYIYGTYYTGGLIGATDQGTVLLIKNCYNEANVIGNSTTAGIIGFVHYLSDATIVNCYNLGAIHSAMSYSAGINAHQGSTVTLKVANCYNLGTITSGASSNRRMLIYSKPTYLTMENCFYDKSKGNKENGGFGATLEQFENGTVATMLREGTFGIYDGSIWGQDVGSDSYPLFRDEISNSKAVKHAVTLHTYEGDKASYFDSYVEGFSKALPVTTREAYSFRGWFNNAEFTGTTVDSILATATTDQEFWAKYERLFTVTLNANGGTIVSDDVTEYVEGIGAKLPKNVTQNNKVFMGWYADEDLSGTPVSSISTTDEGNKTFYAKWMTLKVPQMENSCYVISDVPELYAFAAMINGTSGYSKTPYICGTLSKDIVVNENVLKEDGTLDSARADQHVPWNPLDNITNSFDGRGHTISGLYMNDRSKNYLGFFGRVNGGTTTSPLVIKNLKIKDSYFDGMNYVGGIVASVLSSKVVKLDSVSFDGIAEGKYVVSGLVAQNNGTLEIRNSQTSGFYSYNDPASYTTYVGGLVGWSNAPLSIDNSKNYAAIVGKNNNGGLVGGQSSASLSISESSNEGSVLGSGYNGGFVGNLSNATNIINSYNAGKVEATDNYNGGIVGYNSGTLNLMQSYNTAPVSGKSFVGGLVGYNNTTINMGNCYNLGSVSGNTYVAGLLGYIYQSSSYFASSYVLNSYNMGEVTANNYGDPITYVALRSGAEPPKNFVNNFYLSVEGGKESSFGTAKDRVAFTDTSVTKELHAYVQKDGDGVAVEGGINGLVWAQDSIPMLNTKEYYAVGFVLNGGTLEDAPKTYKTGDELVLPDPTREGYKFKGWFKNPEFGSSDQVVTKIYETDFGNKMFYAMWEILEFTITVSVNNEKAGYVTGLIKDGKYKYNEMVTLNAVAAKGYYFTDWRSDVEEYKSEQITFRVKGDVNLVANFEKESSSSVASSSSESSSSSSAEPESSSSSSVKPSSGSSSSVKPKSSSSSKTPASSSSGKKESIDMARAVPQFALAVVGRDIQVAGATVGSVYAVLDMQGRVIASGRVSASNFNIPLGRVGSYLVRIGTQVKTIKLR